MTTVIRQKCQTALSRPKLITFVTSRTISELRRLIGQKSLLEHAPVLFNAILRVNIWINLISPKTRSIVLGLPGSEDYFHSF